MSQPCGGQPSRVPGDLRRAGRARAGRLAGYRADWPQAPLDHTRRDTGQLRGAGLSERTTAVP
jgi:hypothetical protein